MSCHGNLVVTLVAARRTGGELRPKNGRRWCMVRSSTTQSETDAGVMGAVSETATGTVLSRWLAK